MTDIKEMLFGPLDADYCLYFYIVSVITFVIFSYCVLFTIYELFKRKKFDMIPFIMCLQSLLLYFVKNTPCG